MRRSNGEGVLSVSVVLSGYNTHDGDDLYLMNRPRGGDVTALASEHTRALTSESVQKSQRPQFVKLGGLSLDLRGV